MKLNSYFTQQKTTKNVVSSSLFHSSLHQGISKVRSSVVTNRFCFNNVLSKKVCLKTLFSIIVAISFLPTTSAANTNKKPIRWFEMEVILFSQLGDKTALNENFTNNTPLPTYKGVRELLTEYLQPDISLLRRQLPFCTSSIASNHNSYQAPVINKATMDELLTQQYQQHLASPVDVTLLFKQVLKEHSTLSTVIVNNDTVDQLTDSPNINTVKKTVNHSIKHIPKSDLNQSIFTNFLTTNTSANVTSVYPSTYQYVPVKFTTELCQLSVNDKVVLQQALPAFDENAIKIDAIPRTIDGIERLASNEPYLISQSSLQLHDIVKKLRASREFKPMLHIGWRQAEPAINAKRSIPMHLFAGENLLVSYQQELQQFEQEQRLAQEQESLLQTVFNTNQEQQLIVTEADKDLKIQQIITSLSNIPEDKATLINQLDALAQNTQLTVNEQAINTPVKAPTKPSQDWSIDGLFNVHLDHYLYITADFNIANMTLAEQATESLAKGEPQPIESIRFSQNKRVISKEIHYFDHPYMGMIVQIRRYKRPTAEELLALTDELATSTNINVQNDE